MPASGKGTLAQGYQQVVHVPVEFTLLQEHAASIPDGHVIRGYLLARNSDGRRWLIVDEGPA
ncbi:hypothetical protein [Frankia sp. Cppng1_Ct_nod]|uniref:hypothetical protein n=1 Tax=Frankia sp. Cppng1_Ct_nod TaxID=2897162 RepID=UPI001041A9A5|nr:hypothetical protein [Frankia sp. Cppng1_Ct_nod]